MPQPSSFFKLDLMQPTNSFTLPAFAKINWFLRILGKREDGFHEICTAFQTVSLCDFLSFSENDELLLTCSDPAIPVDQRNLITKAALALKERFKITSGAAIHLEKNIPAPGGLGGGSADCAVALLGLAKLWDIRISRSELSAIGGRLGSDVPFFFEGGTALGSGRGTEIQELDQINADYLIIITPNIDVSTSKAFGLLGAPRLTNISPKSILKLCCDEAGKLDSRHMAPTNDFESVIYGLEPEIERARDKLLELGATTAMMSGSGASILGIFENEETRQATLKALDNEVSWRKFAVATVSRNSYRETLKEVFEVVSD